MGPRPSQQHPHPLHFSDRMPCCIQSRCPWVNRPLVLAGGGFFSRLRVLVFRCFGGGGLNFEITDIISRTTTHRSTARRDAVSDQTSTDASLLEVHQAAWDVEDTTCRSTAMALSTRSGPCSRSKRFVSMTFKIVRISESDSASDRRLLSRRKRPLTKPSAARRRFRR